jgi:hypothetical protein
MVPLETECVSTRRQGCVFWVGETRPLVWLLKASRSSRGGGLTYQLEVVQCFARPPYALLAVAACLSAQLCTCGYGDGLIIYSYLSVHPRQLFQHYCCFWHLPCCAGEGSLGQSSTSASVSISWISHHAFLCPSVTVGTFARWDILAMPFTADKWCRRACLTWFEYFLGMMSICKAAGCDGRRGSGRCVGGEAQGRCSQADSGQTRGRLRHLPRDQQVISRLD